MAKIRFTAAVEGVVFGEVEADSLEACREKIRNIDLVLSDDDYDIEGGTKAITISDIDEEVLERTYKVHVHSVEYDIDENDIPQNMTVEDIVDTLPKEFDFELNAKDEVDLEDMIESEIELNTNWIVSTYKYKILEEK